MTKVSQNNKSTAYNNRTTAYDNKSTAYSELTFLRPTPSPVKKGQHVHTCCFLRNHEGSDFEITRGPTLKSQGVRLCNPEKQDFRELKSKAFPVEYGSRTPLEACTCGAQYNCSKIGHCLSQIRAWGPVRFSNGRYRKLFLPVKPFLVNLYLKTKNCIRLKLLV